MASTADRMEHIRQLPDVLLKGTPFGSKATMRRVRWSDDAEPTLLPDPGEITYPEGETVDVETFAGLLIALAFWPERP